MPHDRGRHASPDREHRAGEILDFDWSATSYFQPWLSASSMWRMRRLPFHPMVQT